MSSKISVLVADDTLIALEGIKMLLEGVGEIGIIAIASTPEDVLKTTKQMQPDVVVLDMKWLDQPRMGLMLIKEIRSYSLKIKIIAMTASPELLSEATEAGAEYTFAKNISRQELIQTIQSVKQNSITRVLFLSADPTDATRLRLGEELREIQEKLQLAKLREGFELHQRISVRPIDISQALLDVQPRIVHFSGHGTSLGALCFEDKSGKMQSVAPEALAALFEQFSSHVDCVILNACYSEIQANAIVKHISYVVGMNQAIGDTAAIAYAIGFYQALGAGRTIEESYKLGCVQIRLQGIPEHLTPVFLRKM